MTTKYRAIKILLFTFVIFLVFTNQVFSTDDNPSTNDQGERNSRNIGSRFNFSDIINIFDTINNQDERSSKVVFVNSSNYCLNVQGINETSEGTEVGIDKCSRVTEKWFFDPSSNKIKTGYHTNRCLDINHLLGFFGNDLQISNCNTAISWSHGDDGKICTYGEIISRCLGFDESWRDSIYLTKYYDVELKHRSRTNSIWSFRSYEPRSYVSGSTEWTINLYGYDDYPNQTNKLDSPLSKLRKFFDYHWKYMPTYLKKHALNRNPTLIVNRKDWDDEVAQGAPWINRSNPGEALDSFTDWIEEIYDTHDERRINFFIKWDNYGREAGRAHTPNPNPRNAISKIGIASIESSRALSHEVGHTFSYQHYNNRCYLPGTGRRYSFMHHSSPKQDDSVWYGPLPCQNQDEVFTIFYQLAFAGHLNEWNHIYFEASISYNEDDNLLTIRNGGPEFRDFINDGGERHLMLGGNGADYDLWASLSSFFEDDEPLGLALFTVVTKDGVHHLVPDDPLAHKFLNYHKSANTKNLLRFFSYHRRR